MTNIKEKMTSKNVKTILFASLTVAMLLSFSAMSMVDAAPNENANDKAKENTGPNENASDKAKLNAQEKAIIPPSIKAYEVSNMASSDVKSKIDLKTLSVDHKGKQHKLVLFENDLFNNAVTNDNTENAIAYTGFVAGEPYDSKVSLVVSDNEFAGFVYTSETIIVIEPLSFYGQEFAGDKQIVYDITDLDFGFTISDDIGETANNNPGNYI